MGNRWARSLGPEGSREPGVGARRGPPDADRCATPEELAGFLDGGLSRPRRAALEAHAADCDRCRELLSALARADSSIDLGDSNATTREATRGGDSPPDDEPLPSGTTAGRYRLLERIGAGGMGVVYAAHDPELNRKVAIKILRARLHDADAPGIPPRLLREARAMAQLAHPNVVAVHDIGRFGDRAFVAMELVDGQTLDEWLAGGERDWRDIVAMFLSAGQGLAAAHAAGLVHRDFKPANVFVGNDGRVRVGDFGLVQGEAPPPAGAPRVGGERAELTAASGPTPGGALVGTPYFMAPEQFAGGPADARSDQFSFCVALYRALYRGHPFDGATTRAYADAVIGGRVHPPPAGVGVPHWLGRVVLRGLSVAPGRRYGSMAELLRALAHDPFRQIRRGAAAGAVLAVIAAALLHAGLLGDERPPCSEVGARLAGVWGFDRRARVMQAFLTTFRPYAGAAFSEVSRVLDRYTDTWRIMRAEVCQADLHHGDPPDEVLGLRTLCLDAALGQVRALADALASASPGMIERAPRAVHELPELSSCADPQALLGPVRPPADPHDGARIASLRDELARVETLHRLGRYPEALAAARALVDQVHAVRFRPLEAEVLFVLGQAADDGGDARAAETGLQQAVLAAEAGGSDAIAARALTRLVLVKGQRLGHADAALELVPRVTAVLERIGGNAEIEGMLHVTLGGVLRSASRFPEAQHEGRLGLDVLERTFGRDDLRVAGALEALGVLAMNRYELATALDLHRRVLAIRRTVFGDDHPEVASAHLELARVLSRMSRFAEARVEAERALGIRERALAPEHPEIGDALAALGEGYLGDRRPAEALPILHRATEYAARSYGRAHVSYGRRLTLEAYAWVASREFARALPMLREALTVLLAVVGPEHTEVSFCRRVLGHALLELGRYQEARSELLDSLSVQDRLLGPNAPLASTQYSLLGEVELKLGDAAHAIRAIERARMLADSGNFDRIWHAGLDFALARALAQARRDPARARTLAESAAAAFASDPQSQRDLHEVHTWFARRGRAGQ